MKIVVDACVLFPTVLREVILGAAETGAFQPLWSDRILEEWRRAAARLGPLDAEIAGAEIAMAHDRFPDALVTATAKTEARLYLPDRDDEHVLAAAIDGGAEALLTLNIKDFPKSTLAAEGIERLHPDAFIFNLWKAEPDAIGTATHHVLERAGGHGIDVSNPRKIMKKARLPRLGKALFQV